MDAIQSIDLRCEMAMEILTDDCSNSNIGIRLDDFDDRYGGNGVKCSVHIRGRNDEEDVPSMYSDLYLSMDPTGSSPLDALAAQSRPGRS